MYSVLVRPASAAAAAAELDDGGESGCPPGSNQTVLKMRPTVKKRLGLSITVKPRKQR